MRLRAGNHGFSSMARAFTVGVIVAASLAQLASLSHEMTVRHFRCAEHGELTHVAAVAMSGVELPSPTGADSLRAQGRAAAGGHEHCAVAFTVEGSTSTSTPSVTGAVAPPPPVAAPVAPRRERGRTVALAAAPKTSPPRA
ncbi:MAG TPA: hypothetical protein VMT03_18265 [Polyangia bacterium]|nr:hypothetical protein [Polyangia bacterium]